MRDHLLTLAMVLTVFFATLAMSAPFMQAANDTFRTPACVSEKRWLDTTGRYVCTEAWA